MRCRPWTKSRLVETKLNQEIQPRLLSTPISTTQSFTSSNCMIFESHTSVHHHHVSEYLISNEPPRWKRYNYPAKTAISKKQEARIEADISSQHSITPPAATQKQNMTDCAISHDKKPESDPLVSTKYVFIPVNLSNVSHSPPFPQSNQFHLPNLTNSSIGTPSIRTRRWRRCASVIRGGQAARSENGPIQQTSLRLHLPTKQCARTSSR